MRKARYRRCPMANARNPPSRSSISHSGTKTAETSKNRLAIGWESVSTLKRMRVGPDLFADFSPTGTTITPPAGTKSAIRPMDEQHGDAETAPRIWIALSEWLASLNSWRIVWPEANTRPKSISWNCSTDERSGRILCLAIDASWRATNRVQSPTARAEQSRAATAPFSSVSPTDECALAS